GAQRGIAADGRRGGLRSGAGQGGRLAGEPFGNATEARRRAGEMATAAGDGRRGGSSRQIVRALLQGEKGGDGPARGGSDRVGLPHGGAEASLAARGDARLLRSQGAALGAGAAGGADAVRAVRADGGERHSSGAAVGPGAGGSEQASGPR